MKKFLILVLFTSIGYQSLAQSSSPAQTLRLATSTYEQGRLHELEGILGKLTDFTTEQKVAAYKLLTQAYIYLEEPKKADSTMLNLLNTDHYFRINPDIDPAEFVALYKTFRTVPILAVGLKVGGALTLPSVMSDYYVADAANGTGKYTPGLGFTVGFVVEKEIGKGEVKKIVLAPEILLTTRSVTENGLLFKNDSTHLTGGSYQIVYKQTWLDFNAIVRYNLKGNFNPYVGIGPGIGYSLNQTAQLTTTGLTKTSVSGADVNLKNSFNTTVYSVIGVAGAKLRIGSIYVVAEVRYQHGLTNVINSSSRTNIEMATDYAATSNNFKQSNVSGTLAVVYPIFKPIKLKR